MTTSPQAEQAIQEKTMYKILLAISFVHLLNDSMQAVITAIFPILEKSMNLNYLQLGFISFALNMTSSVMQPVVGWYADRKPRPFVLPIGLGFTLIGMLGLAFANNYVYVVLSVIFVGLGSAAFHPEGSRVAYLAAGPRRGLAQSIYQVGGNTGSALGPVMTALIFVPMGQFGAIWFTAVAALAIVVLLYVASWYQRQLGVNPRIIKPKAVKKSINPERVKKVRFAMAVLVLLVFARSWYHASISNFYPLFLIKEYGITTEAAMSYLFAFSIMGVVGTFLGGPLADKFGRRNLIMLSMLGATPLAVFLPYANLSWAYAILIINGFILLSSFSVTVVYAQELVPGNIGMVSGLIVGLAFGMGAIGSVALGALGDMFGLKTVMILGSLLPLLGIFTAFLPSDEKLRNWEKEDING